jgi:hypothetical protein
VEEETMRSWFRHAALMLALLAGAALAVAQESAGTDHTVGIATPPAGAPVDDDTTGSTGTVGVGHGNILPLSDEQQGWIFLGVINLPDVPEATVSALEATAALPGSVELQELPAIVTQRIPLVGNYKFVKLEDRILLVDPANREVVAEIPRFKLVN